MAISLVDLLPAVKRIGVVEIAGHEVECHPLTLSQIAILLADVPELGQLVDPNADGLSTGTLLEKLAPAVIGKIIAAGTGHFGDADQAAAASQYPADIQGDLLTKIIDLTSPEGLLPFVTRLMGILGGRDRGLVRAGTGPKRSADSSAPVTELPKSGNIRRAS